MLKTKKQQDETKCCTGVMKWYWHWICHYDHQGLPTLVEVSSWFPHILQPLVSAGQVASFLCVLGVWSVARCRFLYSVHFAGILTLVSNYHKTIKGECSWDRRMHFVRGQVSQHMHVYCSLATIQNVLWKVGQNSNACPVGVILEVRVDFTLRLLYLRERTPVPIK